MQTKQQASRTRGSVKGPIPVAYIHMNFRSSQISRSVYPLVFLPDLNLWRDVEPPYPTLYFLHGYSGGAVETAMFSNIALYAMRYGVAVVMPDGENSFYTDDEKRNANFSRFIGEELVDVTRSVLPLSSRPEDTWIAGISMGGYGALINGLRWRERFSKIGMLSPALGYRLENDGVPEGCLVPAKELRETLGTWKEYAGSLRDEKHMLLSAAESGGPVPELFAAIGKSDPLYPAVTAFREFSRKAGHEPAWYEAEGGHDHTFWKQALDPLFHFLTGKEGV